MSRRKVDRTVVACLAGAMALLMGRPQETATGASTTPSPPAVSVGSESGTPRSKVTIPLTLLTGGKKVTRCTTEIRFFKSSLSFVEVKLGPAANNASATLQHEVREDADPKLSILKMSVTGKQELTDGVLVQMIFSISENARELLTLRNVSNTFVVNGTEIKGGLSKDGEILVLGAAPTIVSGCFFYMH